MMLTGVEDAFRSMKSELGLRTIFHRLSRRVEAHLFITVLTYHFQTVIQRKLREQGLRHRWETIRSRMATQIRVTTSMTTENGQRIHLRNTSDPEPFHLQAYRALGLPKIPLGVVKTR
jgi:transposase